MCTDLIVILGPTAVGKTSLTIRLARLLDCCVINADSRQLYSMLPIGTAAPTAEQLASAKHHFVGTLHSPADYYSAAQYEQDVMELLGNMEGKVILSGGSMMYIDAVCQGIDDIPTISDEVRSELKRRLAEEGIERLTSELRLLDPEYHAICDLRNHKRVVHALEVCYQSGRTYTSFRQRATRQRPFRIHKIGLERPREELFARINARVDEMMRQGLLEEATALLPYRECNALNTVGYKELFAYMDGKMTLAESVERIKKNTRVYAKKQMTWFKKDAAVQWFGADDEEKIVDAVKTICCQQK